MVADPSRVERADALLTVAHDLERCADRTANICERAVYIATADLIELDCQEQSSA